MEQAFITNDPANEPHRTTDGISVSAANTLKLTKELIFLSSCVLAAFLIRFFLLPSDTVINGDGVYYTILGEKLVSGDIAGGISAYWSPLYSALTGITSLFFEDKTFAGRFVSLIAGSLLIIPAFFLIREFYGRLTAYFGTILLVIHPSLIEASGWVMTESLYALIFTSGILFGWYALKNGSSRYFLITGLLLGAAFLTKAEAIGFLFLILFFISGAFVFKIRLSRRRLVGGSLLLLLGFSIFFVPYVVFLRQKVGHWTISQKIMINLPFLDYEGELLELTSDGSITMQDRIWNDDYESGKGFPNTVTATQSLPVKQTSIWDAVKILGSKGLFLLKKQIRDYFPQVLPYSFILIAIAGFFFQPWSRLRAAKEFYLLAFVVSTLLGYAFSVVELRYIYPLIPILIAWVANGIVGFGDWARASIANSFRENRTLTSALFQTVVLLSFAGMFVWTLLANPKNENLQDVPFEDKQAGLWLKNNSSLIRPVIMSPNAIVAFYAGARHVFLPKEDLPTILEYAKRRNVNYIVFSDRRARFNPSAIPPTETDRLGMTLVYQAESVQNQKIVIYQLF